MKESFGYGAVWCAWLAVWQWLFHNSEPVTVSHLLTCAATGLVCWLVLVAWDNRD